MDLLRLSLTFFFGSSSLPRTVLFTATYYLPSHLYHWWILQFLEDWFQTTLYN